MKANRKQGLFIVSVVLLLALAVYQIVLNFWNMPLEQISRNRFKEVEPAETANMLEPEEMFTTLGTEEGSYSRLSQQEEAFEELFRPSYELVRRTMREGKAWLGDLDTLDWERQACVMPYGFELTSVMLAAQLEISESVFDVMGLSDMKWSEIWVMPSQSRIEQVVVCLVDPDSGRCAHIAADGWDWEENQQLLEVMLDQGTELKKTYLACGLLWSDWGIKEGFVLEQTQRAMYVRAGAISPFIKNGEIDTKQMNQYALKFFEYPDTVTIKETENVFSYMNEKITVKLDASGRLQYVETLTSEEKEALTMREAFQLAVGFMQQDLGWEDSAYLDYAFAGAELDGDSYIFYFNYMIGGIPYRMETAKTVQWRMKYPVKITVEGQKVRRYERYVLDIDVEPESETQLRSNWIDAMDQLEKKNWNVVSVPKLWYYIYGNRLILQWEAEALEGRVWTGAS